MTSVESVFNKIDMCEKMYLLSKAGFYLNSHYPNIADDCYDSRLAYTGIGILAISCNNR